MKSTKVYFLIGACLLMISPLVQAAASRGVVDQLPRLSIGYDSVANNRYYKKLLVSENPSLIETNKIMYLIDTLRKSPHQFERNGEIYRSAKAANHLMMKYAYVKSRVNTVEDFIDHLASKSSSTGKEYHVIVSEEEKYPVKTILYNELGYLEQALKNRSSKDQALQKIS